ncbi:hypothetical protein [Nocardia cyriacigeorgica]|uniref:Uncharacterized protein n=1 Tax=Nocardia cyriacigeorgica TaxID=135487 RepID=A0A5R8NFR1_9NOCA|nr:hypothetical protein [Nocardia cyriacigeorgica]TLF74500.1 hypothetical protein FEK34_24380 [Nocardia cyriacigeorgica]
MSEKRADANGMSWSTGEGLLEVSDPKVVDRAFACGEPHVGIAVVGLSLNNPDPDEVAPRIVRATLSVDRETRRLGFVALGHFVRINRRITPELAGALRDSASDGISETALDDTLSYVPFRRLPPWLKVRFVADRLEWIFSERWKG